MRRHLVPAGLVLTAVLVSAAVATGGSGAGTAAASATSRTIASTTTSDFKVLVSARNLGGGGGAPSAAVTVRTFERAGAGWRRTNERRLAGTYFWKTITGPLAICRLEIRTTAAQAAFPAARDRPAAPLTVARMRARDRACAFTLGQRIRLRSLSAIGDPRCGFPVLRTR